MIGDNTSNIASSPQYFFQEKPISHHEHSYKEWYFCSTIAGYWNEAGKVVSAILMNEVLNRTKYEVWATIVITKKSMSLAEHIALWRRFCKSALHKGLSFFWVREPSRSGGMHYHILLASPADIENAQIALRGIVPRKHKKHVQISVDEVWDTCGLANYIMKAKVVCETSDDKYAQDRLMFLKNLPLDKHGAVGHWWQAVPDDLYRQHSERETALGQRRTLDLRRQAQRLSDLLQGPYTLSYCERQLLEWDLKEFQDKNLKKPVTT